MATRLVQINMKARDAAALGRFWAEVLGWGIDSEEFGTSLEPVGFAYPDPAAVCIDIIARPEPKTVKNRVHVDLATTSAAHQAELVARLKDLGATPADVGQGDVPWTVMANPEGNEFCVLEPRLLYQGTGPIASVVVDCADPRAMARFWGEAMDWTRTRSPTTTRSCALPRTSAPTWSSSAPPTPGPCGTASTSTSAPTRATTWRQRKPACAPWAPPTPASTSPTSTGRSSSTRKATSSASSPPADLV